MTDQKKCLLCGADFTRRDNEAKATFARRQYCSRACGAKVPRPKLDLPASKDCEACGKTIFRPDGLRSRQWQERKYCDSTCAGVGLSRVKEEARPERRCPICREVFKTTLSQRKRATCGREECKTEYKRTIAAAKVSRRMRAEYASGRRVPAKGISPREVILWGTMIEWGEWVSGLSWVDKDGAFQLDFACIGRKLNVELDGPEHYHPKRQARDEQRDDCLRSKGWEILRIANEAVDGDPEAVLERIRAWSDSRPGASSNPHR